MGAHVHLCVSLVLCVKAYTLHTTYVFLRYTYLFNHLICPTHHQTGAEKLLLPPCIMAYLIETLVRCACTQTGTHARMYNTHTHCFLCHSIPPCTHGRDMLYVYTTLHVTTCLWNIGLVKLAKIISSVQITLSLYPYTSPSHLMLPLHPLTSPSYFILSPHLWPHPLTSPSHFTLSLYPPTSGSPPGRLYRVKTCGFTRVQHTGGWRIHQVYLLGKSEVVSLCIQP